MTWNWEAIDWGQAMTNALLISIYVEMLKRPRKGTDE